MPQLLLLIVSFREASLLQQLHLLLLLPLLQQMAFVSPGAP